MELARFLDGFHRPDCSGCPACDVVAAALLANPENPSLIVAMGNTRLHALADTALQRQEEENALLAPPDGYAIALRARAAAEGSPATQEQAVLRVADLGDEETQLRAMESYRASFFQTLIIGRRAFARSSTDVPPAPDPYAAGLKALKERDKC